MTVKICGMTNVHDTLNAVEAGADAVGFIFAPSSPRYVTQETTRTIIRELPPHVTPVGVFVNMPQQTILEVIEMTGIRALQLHGDEMPEATQGFPVPVWKAFRVGKDFRVDALEAFNVSAYLLDAFVEGRYGGTGKTFDWRIAVAAKKYGRIILSGGLTPANIGDAIRTVQPHGVDVNSGVELSPGKKDKTRMRDLMLRIQEAECSLS